MSAEEKFVMIDNDFIEKGLTLEEAYILGRVKSLQDENLIYRETNEALANAMGKSVKAVKNWINSLVKKGYLRKEHQGRCRMLYVTDAKKLFEKSEKARKELKESIFGEEPKEQKKSPFDGMNSDEKVTYLKTAIDQSKFLNSKMSRDEALQYAQNKIQQNKNKIYKNVDEDFY
jgi:DNA-binding MarR family transcriptional regulator